MNSIEKNNLYHAILDILKLANNKQDAARDILMLLEQFMTEKSVDMLGDDCIETEASALAPKTSPIFRRSQ
jgi:hypothetical protein